MGKSYRHSQRVQRNRMCLGQGNRAGFLRTEITPLASEITLHTKNDRIYKLFRAQSYLNSAILQNMPAQTWRLILFRQNTWPMSRMAVKMKARNGSHNSPHGLKLFEKTTQHAIPRPFQYALDIIRKFEKPLRFSRSL